MDFRAINLETIKEVATALNELLSEFVFVGGAVIILYIDDLAADEIRTTNDIDLTIQLSKYSEWVNLQEKLSRLGFYPNPQGHATCSFTYKGILVDIMPSENGDLGISNTWYKQGFEHLKKVKIDDLTISILQSPYFLATKFEAFNGRGGDYRTSHDFEDIIYVLDNCTTIVEEILQADEKVKNFLKSEFLKIKTFSYFEEIILAHTSSNRTSIVIEKINKILE
jgi:predicted nucleotidyltransferase